MEDKAVQFKVIEEMDTIQGEGLFAGRPTHFIRLANCNLDCVWCDSNRGIPDPTKNDYHEILELNVGKHASQTIVDLRRGRMPGNFCFTGGEPLLYSLEIARWLAQMIGVGEFLSATIETGGGMPVKGFRKLLYHHLFNLATGGESVRVVEAAMEVVEKVSVCVDYKLSSSGKGAHGRMIMENFAPSMLSRKDSVKFVVFDETDLNEAVQVIEEHRFDKFTNLFLSPCWDNNFEMFKQRSQMVAGAVQGLAERDVFAGISLQQHKIVGMK